MNTQEQQQIANTILQQLGGNRFIAMTGAKNFGFATNDKDETFISFKIGRNSKRLSLNLRISITIC